MDDETLRDFSSVVRGYIAGRLGNNGKPNQAMLDLGASAAEGEEA